MHKLKLSASTPTRHQQERWSYFPNTRKGGWGCIIRNHKGECLAAGVGALQGLSNAMLRLWLVGKLRS